MTFPLILLCELLDGLENNRRKVRNANRAQELDNSTIVAWFRRHSKLVPRQGSSAIAFLSCLFPERRADRIFGLGAKRLEKIIQQAQCLGMSRMDELRNCKKERRCRLCFLR